MIKFVKKIVRAPLTYLADLRKITLKQYLLLHTNFSPSYPIMAFFALAASLALGGFIIFQVITVPEEDNCFKDVRVGAYIISVLYPIETILFFICITGSVALSKSNCWKVTWMLLMGPLLCGFGFGELGFIEMCLLSAYNEDTFKIASLFKKRGFIDSMVYLYITFFIFYFVLVLIFYFLYHRQKKDE